MTSDLIQNVIGFAAAALVFATFYMKTMLPLRFVAVASNLAFMSYGYIAQLYPIFLLHLVLLPLNIYRLFQIWDVLRRIRASQSPQLLADAITPLMTRETFAKGSMIFRKGELADKMYLLLAGSVELLEIQTLLPPGVIFGEIGLFSEEGTRIASARCSSDVTVGSLTKFEVETAFLQNPEFGSALVRILTTRLIEDINRLETNGYPYTSQL